MNKAPGAVSSLSRNASILYVTAFLRAVAIGMLGVLLGLYLARLEYSIGQIGIVISAGLWGIVAASSIVMLRGDRIGHRRALLALALLSASGGVGALFAPALGVMVSVAFFGMLKGMGRDRGALLIVEQAMLPGEVTDAQRTRAFAWYNVLQDVGHALGSLCAALPTLLRGAAGIDELASIRAALLLYVALFLLSALLYANVAPSSAAPRTSAHTVLTPESRRVLGRICALFALDSVAGGFFGTALLAYFFAERFGVSEAAIGVLFFGARLMNALSHVAAAWLARRIGLVNTMVFTHIPSSLLLMTVAIAPSFPVAAILFLLREGLVEMDVPTRQSYVMAVVRPEERTFASAATHLVRIGGWAIAPSFAGALMQGVALTTPIYVGAAMKIAYDIALYFSFRGVKPPEERGGGP
jgi:MFS family permease